MPEPAHESGKNYGIPARMPATTSLWAHLLRKDTQRHTAKNPDIILPPITPLDKNGTSMRILLHDTQAHLDKFAASADKMFAGVEDAKSEILIVNTLFQREHETLTDELVDLVNRSQTQLQSTIGTPAQAEQLGRLSKDVNVNLEAIVKRLDAFQSFNQTHSQMLQLQSQAIQTLQEQHATVLTALLPLLPLLQAMPLHIDAARNHISELLTALDRTPSSQARTSNDDRGRPITIHRSRRSKRSSSTLHSDGSPSPSMRKKSRGLPGGASGLPRVPSALLTTPVMVIQPIRREFGTSLRGFIPPVSAPSVPSLKRKETMIIPSPPRRVPTKSVPKQASCLNTSSSSPYSVPGPSSERYLNFLRSDSGPLRPALFSKTSPMLELDANIEIRPSSIPPAVSTTISPETTRSSAAPRPRTSRPRPVAQIAKPLRKVLEPLSATPRSDNEALKPIEGTEFLPTSINRSSKVLFGHPAQHSPTITISNTPSRPPVWNTLLASKGLPMARPPTHALPQLRLPQKPTVFLPDQTSGKLFETVPTATPSPVSLPQKIRERRSPLKEGRRFIPLDDSDDDVNSDNYDG